MKNKGFDKFINHKSNAAKKEKFKQQKRKIKQEIRQQKEQRFRDNQNRFNDNTDRQNPPADNNERPFKKKFDKPKHSFNKREKPFTQDQTADNNERPFKKKFDKPQRSFTKREKPFNQDQPNDNNERPFKKKFDKPQRSSNEREKPFKSEHQPFKRNAVKPFRKTNEGASTSFNKNPSNTSNKKTSEPQAAHQPMPLNKYVAHAGICGRREAAEMVKGGKVKVNNEVIIEPGYKVKAEDKVAVNGKLIYAQKNLVYILLNKPKDYITTTSDPEGRKTIFELIKNATDERVFPVGRLDRNTTGVLLLTNDGELTQKLTHPSFRIKKIYEVRLDKPLAKKDMDAVANGLELEDGFIAADSIGYADASDKSIVGIEIHSGRNRIVRRIFEHLGYDVKNLDRVLFANLTKKNVERGKWRLLKEKEIRLLKYMNQSFVKKDVQQNENFHFAAKPQFVAKKKLAVSKRTRPEKK